MSENAQQLALREARLVLEPLLEASGDVEAVGELLEQLGWVLDTGAGGAVAKVAQALAATAGAIEALDALASPADGQPGPETLTASLAAIRSVTEVVDALQQVADAFDPAPPPDTFAALPGELIEHLFLDYLDTYHPAVLNALVLLTLVEPGGAAPPTPAVSDASGTALRIARSRHRLKLDRLGPLASDPVGTLKQAYVRPTGLQTVADAAYTADRLFPRIASLVQSLGATAMYSFKPDHGYDLGTAGPELLGHTLGLWVPIPVDGGTLDLGATFALSPADRGGLGLVVRPFGELEATADVAGWQLGGRVGGGITGFWLNASGVHFPAQADPSATVQLTLAKAAGADGPALLLGSATGTRLEVGGLTLTLDGAFSSQRTDYGFDIDIAKAAIVVAAGDGDGFLAKVLPKDGLRAEFDLGLGWSKRLGVHFRGAAGLQAELPLHADLGPLSIPTLFVRLSGSADGAELVVAATAKLMLGPIQATVERVGLRLAFDGRDLDLGFKPPDGAGLAIEAGPVTGGGYLLFDPAQSQYAGALQLEFGAIALKAIGLLTTKMPDGSAGFSLLVIISAEFTPVQLGFGFTLSGVGGLLGINRTVAVDALRAGVRNRTVESIMFPKDPVANAPQIISNLRSVFPPAPGRHVLGPMVRLNWGTPALITLDLGLVLELPAPVRLVVLGRLHATLPRPEAPLVSINMDVIGIVDFGRGEASIDATLYDSTIAGFTLSGDMAMRASWKERPGFALSAGGFHPSFQPPPGFPALRRLALALATGDNPRLRLETYLALTSNTVQFGARLELYAEAAGFSVEGMLAFDVLFQLHPFAFLADMQGSLALKRGSRTLMGVSIKVALSGPSPWHARGTATFEILMFSGTVSFDVTFGSRAAQPLPAPVDVGQALDTALADPRNWSAQLPPAGQSAITLRQLTPAADELLAHPLGTISVTQRVAPFGVELTRFGAAPVQGDKRFDVTAFTVAGASPATDPLLEDFAPAQFREMSDHQKLSSPSFERREAGRKLRAPGMSFDASSRTPMVLEYETAILDAPDAPTRRQDPEAMTAADLIRLSATSAAALADTRNTGSGRFT